MNPLAPILQAFFTQFLTRQRAASPAIIRTYRDTWRLFLTYLTDTTGTPSFKLGLDDITQQSVMSFLNYLEQDRHNSISTRNLRLAGIKAVMAFCATTVPEHLDSIARINAIPI